MARQSSLISTGEHTQSKKWIRTTTQAQTTWQEEAGQCIAAICGADYATSVECVLRPYKECAGGKRGSGDDCRGASRDDASPQDCIQRPDWNAGQRQEDGEEVRHQNNGAADQRDAPHKYIHWPSKETPSSTTRCQDQTQEVMAQAFGNSDVHPGEAVRSVRGPAERLSRAHTGIQEGDTNLQTDNAETQCSGCRSSDSGAGHRGGRPSRTSPPRFRRSRTSLQGEQDAQKVPQVVSGERHDRAAVGRRRRLSDGSTGIKEAAFLRTRIWKWLLLSIGSGCTSPFEIAHHVPDINGGISVDSLADAYRWPLGPYAACQDGTETMSCLAITDAHDLPLHPVLFEPKCVHPFMALHFAYLLQAQCRDESGLSLISRPCDLRSSLRKPGPMLSKTVTFSSLTTMWLINEDEIGDTMSSPMTLFEKKLKSWKNKPWRLRPPAPLKCHFTDHHTQSASEAFHAEFGAGEQQQIPNPHDIRLQPIYIQDLEIALQQFGDLNMDTQERSMDVLTWYLHGQRLRECRRPRTVRLSDDFLQWPHVLKRAWADEINQRLAVHFYVLLPDPPVAHDHDDHAAQIVLVQQPRPHDSAAIFTSVYHSAERIAIQRLVRFSARQLHRDDAIALAEILVQVQHRPIQAYYGWRPILDAPEDPLPIPDGASIVIHVRALHAPQQPPGSSTDDDAILWEEEGSLTTGQAEPPRSRSRSPRHQPDEHPDDAASFMAHQMTVHEPSEAIIDIPAAVVQDDDVDFESPTSSSGSTYASDVQSHFFHVFGLNRPSTAVRIRTDTWATMHSNIRHALQLHRHEVQAIHMVNYRPQDLFAAGTLVAIVQRVDDLVPGDLRQLVLVDVLFHGHNVDDFVVRRYALPLRRDTTRRILLEELRLQPYCASVRQRCLIKLNNWLVPLSNHALFELHHGDYLRIDLPPHPRFDIPTQAVACCLRQGFHIRDVQHIYDQAEIPFEWEPLNIAEEGTDDHSLLQTHTRYQVPNS